MEWLFIANWLFFTVQSENWAISRETLAILAISSLFQNARQRLSWYHAPPLPAASTAC